MTLDENSSLPKGNAALMGAFSLILNRVLNLNLTHNHKHHYERTWI